jgi:hypothetical protein
LKEERALVLYHNRYAETRGWIRISIPYPVKAIGSEETHMVQKSLGEGLALKNEPQAYVIYRDQISGLEYLRNCQELFTAGLYIELKAYEYHVFLDFRLVMDDESRHYARLAEYLQGGGVPNMDDALIELEILDLLQPYRELVNSGWYRWLIDHRFKPQTDISTESEEQPSGEHLPRFSQEMIDIEPVLAECEAKVLKVYTQVQAKTGPDGDPEGAAQQTRQDLTAALALPVLPEWLDLPSLLSSVPAGTVTDTLPAAIDYLQEGPGQGKLGEGDPALWGTLFNWVFNRRLSQAGFDENTPQQDRLWLDEWLLGKVCRGALQGLGLDEGAATRQVWLLKFLIENQNWFQGDENAKVDLPALLQSWVADPSVQQYININRYDDILWFNQQGFDELLWYAYATAVLQICDQYLLKEDAPDLAATAVKDCFAGIQRLQSAAEQSGFQVLKLIEAINR